jgi:hypothetical protein
MGEKFLEQKAKRFKHKRDLEHERELRSPNLLSAIKDRQRKHYRFSCPNEKLALGSPVMFVAEEDRVRVTVFRGVRRVGEVDAAGSAELKSLFAQHPALSNSVRAKVFTGPDIAGFYEATVLPPRGK